MLYSECQCIDVAYQQCLILEECRKLIVKPFQCRFKLLYGFKVKLGVFSLLIISGSCFVTL